MPSLFSRSSSALLLCVVLVGCSSSPAVDDAPPAPPALPSGPVADDGSVARLQTMMSEFAADSMEGRSAGSAGHYRATAYLARKASELGLEPAGENETFFQEVPIRTRTPFSNATVDGVPIALTDDAVPVPPTAGFPFGATGDLNGVAVIYGGRQFAQNEIPAADGVGKVVVLGAGIGPNGPAYGIAPPVIEKFSSAAAIVLAVLDYAPEGLADGLSAPSALLLGGSEPTDGPLLIFTTNRVAELMIGGDIDQTVPGTVGTPLEGTIGFREDEPEAPTRNVVALLPGSDAVLRDEYVVISAHSDHLAPKSPPVADHDSLRAYLQVVRPRGAENPAREATPEEAERIAQIRAAQGSMGQPRPDSISNGADDDGSGSVSLLEIARALQNIADPPRRSVLFVWHTAEELGLFGAQYFTDNPTVPLESIVAGLNADMVGRGGPEDMPNGGPSYIQLIGSRRLSTQLGDLVEAVNREQSHGFTFDYSYDADGHPDNFYCRSDHYMYARYGVPIAFFTTGGHRDYHQLTDEPQYIDYEKLSRVSALVGSVAQGVANLDQRVLVDGVLPDPLAPCQQ